MTKIRALREGDFEQLLELLKQLTVTEVNLDLCDRVYRRAAPAKTTYVIEKDDRIIATGSLVIEPKYTRGYRPLGHIEDVVVNHDQRGKGYGELIVRYLIGLANSEDCYAVKLNCSATNVPFYERCGMYKTEEVQMRVDFVQKG